MEHIGNSFRSKLSRIDTKTDLNKILSAPVSHRDLRETGPKGWIYETPPN